MSNSSNEKTMLFTGIDPGNITTKISFLNNSGNPESFNIPTVISDAPATAVNYNSEFDKSNSKLVEDYIHIRVQSDALGKDQSNKTFYVGEIAKNSSEKEQPKMLENGNSEDKFTDSNSKVFILPVLAGMAIAAIKNGQRNVIAPLSTGMPSKSYLKHEQSLKQRFIGKHIITFIDGPYVNQEVQIDILPNQAQIHAESVTTAIALKYDVKDFHIVETQLKETLNDKTYAIADLGAGTSDYAVFNVDGLDKVMTRIFAEGNSSKLSRVATNGYIDRIIDAVYNDASFASQRAIIEQIGDESRKPSELTSREIFMKKIIKPVVDNVLALQKQDPNVQIEDVLKFQFTWTSAKNIDITDHVTNEMKAYAEEQLLNVELAWISANTDYILVVGGGLLFGYFGGLDKLKEKGVLIPNLLDSQYFNSKAYLIINYLTNMPSIQEVASDN